MPDNNSGSSSSDDMANSDSKSSSSSWVSSIKTLFDDTMDAQRIERLRSCRVLENILTDCRKSRQNNNRTNGTATATTSTDRTQLEDVPSGIRMVRYFQWRDVHDYDRKCSREAHAVWACRAGALQCGSELVQLRNCFLEQQHTLSTTTTPSVESGNLSKIGDPNYGAILKYSTTAYENKAGRNKDDLPCASFQANVGQCVARNAKLLAEREKARTTIASAKKEDIVQPEVQDSI